MTATELDRSALAQGVRDATADLRELTLHDVIERYPALSGVRAESWRDGYHATLVQAELVAWGLWQATRAVVLDPKRPVAA